MKILIDIDEKNFLACKHWLDEGVAQWAEAIIANGTPLSKRPQGDLISREALKKAICEKGIKGYEEYNQGLATALDLIDLAPTISPYKAIHDELHKGEEE